MTAFKTLQAFENCYETMMPAQERSNEAFAWFTRVPHSLFNIVMHLKEEDNLNNKIEALISQTPKNIPLSFWLHTLNGSNNLKEILKKKGFQLNTTCPLMTWAVKPVALSNGHIEAANFEIFSDILATTFHLDEVVTEGYAKLLEKDGIENYLIFIDAQPVGIGTLISKGKIGGIFNIGTLPEYQKRGCGRAMMNFLMNRASMLGLDELILLSTPEAEKLYSGLGFIKSLDIEIYVKRNF